MILIKAATSYATTLPARVEVEMQLINNEFRIGELDPMFGIGSVFGGPAHCGCWMMCFKYHHDDTMCFPRAWKRVYDNI